MTKQIKADIALLAITAIWGVSFTLMKNVLDHIPSFPYLSLRFIIAGIVLAIVYRKKLMLINSRALLQGCVIGTMLFGGMALQVSGLYFTSASNSAFITGMTVIIVPIISAVILRKKPDRASIAGVVLALAGLFLLTGGLNFCFNRGDFLTLLCAVCFAFHIIFIDKFTMEQSPELLAVLQIVFAALLYSGVWLFLDYKPIEFNFTIIYTLLITGVLSTALAFTVQTVAQKHTTPTHTALIMVAEPVFGAVFALLIPNSLGVTETLRINSVAGCLLILAGMLVCELGIKKTVSK